jgi:4'-phosphopantetheinyl transferase
MMLDNAPAQLAGRSGATRLSPTMPMLWLADIAPARRADWIDAHAGWLSASERARWQRIARPERRAQFLAGHVLLRRLVAACGTDAAADVVVTSGDDGRPGVSGWQPSLAHSKQWVAALLDADGAPVGVDIEWMLPARQIETIVRLACSVEADSPERAYLVWAQREAEIKAGSQRQSTRVATWNGHALAACASAAPAVALVDLETQTAPVALGFAWTTISPLPLTLQDGR